MKKKILVLGVVLALLSALVVPMAVLAEDTVVSGTIAGELTLTPPEAVTLPSLTIADSPHVANAVAGNVYSTSTYTLTVADADQNSKAGYLIAATTTAGTSTSVGTTTTIIDTSLTQADDFWNGWYVVWTSGTLDTETQQVTDFDADADTLTTDAFTEATPTGATFTLFMPLTNAMLFATAATADLTISGYQTELQGLTGHGEAGNFAVPLYVLQARVVGDDVADTYSLTLTYTVTAS